MTRPLRYRSRWAWEGFCAQPHYRLHVMPIRDIDYMLVALVRYVGVEAQARSVVLITTRRSRIHLKDMSCAVLDYARRAGRRVEVLERAILPPLGLVL